MQYDYGPGGAYFLVCMVYLKAYSLTVAKITIAIVMIDAREYYKNINPQGLSDNYSFAILSASVMICHTQLSHTASPVQQNRKQNDHERLYCLITTYVDYTHDSK